MKELIGRQIREVRIGDAAQLLVFQVGTGRYIGREFIAYRTEGDCCSETWFSAINGIEALIDQTVTDVIERETVEAPGTRQAEDTLYGYTLVTATGHCDIEFRNSSNGYYGGSCYQVEFERGEHSAKWAALAPVENHFALI